MTARIERLSLEATLREAGALEQINGALVYLSPIFARFLARVTNAEVRYLVARRAGAVVGALPYAVSEDGASGCVVNSLPWYGSHGGCWLQDPTDTAVRGALLDAYRQDLAALRPLFTTTVLSPWEEPYADAYAKVLEVSVRQHRIGQMSALPSVAGDPEPVLLKLVSQKTRNLVRKSLRQGFEETVGHDAAAWDFLERTHQENMAAVGGRAKPAAHFQAMREVFGEDSLRLSVARLDGRPVAALLLLLFRRSVEYFVPVIAREHRSRQPLSFLIWRALNDLAAAGYRLWNWGGTWLEQRSLHHFKAGWGAEDQPYSYLVHASETGFRWIEDDPESLFSTHPYFYIYPDAALPSASHSYRV